ncbi:MAG: Yip1 family protein [Anaerolineaceae bacterium]|jgi:hypothetical protein
MQASSSTSSPRPFSEITSLWLKVFQMDEAFFAAEAPRTSNSNTLVALLIYAVVAMIVGFIQRSFGLRQLLNQRLFGNTPNVNIPICLPLILIVVVPLGYYIGIGLMHLGAMIFGGRGSYTTLAYLVSLFYIPLGIISGVLGLIPCIGGLISLAAGIFQIVLSVRAIKVNYQLSTGRAVGAYFVPAVVILIIVGCLIALAVLVAGAALGPSLGGIFSNIMQNLATPAP